MTFKWKALELQTDRQAKPLLLQILYNQPSLWLLREGLGFPLGSPRGFSSFPTSCWAECWRAQCRVGVFRQELVSRQACKPANAPCSRSEGYRLPDRKQGNYDKRRSLNQLPSVRQSLQFLLDSVFQYDGVETTNSRHVEPLSWT